MVLLQMQSRIEDEPFGLNFMQITYCVHSTL